MHHDSKPLLGSVNSNGKGELDTFASDVRSHIKDDAVHENHHGAGFLKAGGLPSSVYTLCAMSLGVGVFVLPATLKDMGLITGLIAILFFAVWSNTMQVILVKVAKKQHPPVHSYEELTERVLGKPGAFFLALFTAVTTFLGNSAHMKTVVGILEQVMEYFVTGTMGVKTYSTGHKLILYFFLLAVALVKSADKQISSMRYISTASVGMVLLVCLWTVGECVFWYWPLGHTAFSGENAIIMASDDWKAYAGNLPAVAFAFSGTFCLFPVYNEMTDKSLKNTKKAIGLSSIVCGVGYATVALIGVLTFGKRVDLNQASGLAADNFLDVFPPNHYVVTLLSFCLVGTITLLYAVINFPFLQAVTEMINLVACTNGEIKFIKTVRGRMLITVIGMGGVVAVNLGFTNLLTLFGFCGGWGISFVVYFIPSAIALADSKGEPLWYKAALVLSLLGVLVLAAGFTYVTFVVSPTDSGNSTTITPTTHHDEFSF
eukprot:m.224611 g.224611  ORF g.224611 m.224611 type:complete len:487 (-) comp33438_c0_seq2:75-1535(-)